MPGRRSPLKAGAWVCAGLLLLATGPAERRVAARPPSPIFTATADVFRRRCIACHGPEDASGGLRLDSYQSVMQGGDQGPAIIAGDPRASLLFQKILRRDQPAMPPRRRLTRGDLERIRAWIEAGAPP